jgi:hypothetical protein
MDGAGGSGKTETLRDCGGGPCAAAPADVRHADQRRAANTCGSPVIVLPCSPAVEPQLLSRFLTVSATRVKQRDLITRLQGLVSTGTWAIFENLTALSGSTMSALVQLLRSLRAAQSGAERPALRECRAC